MLLRPHHLCPQLAASAGLLSSARCHTACSLWCLPLYVTVACAEELRNPTKDKLAEVFDGSEVETELAMAYKGGPSFNRYSQMIAR